MSKYPNWWEAHQLAIYKHTVTEKLSTASASGHTGIRTHDLRNSNLAFWPLGHIASLFRAILYNVYVIEQIIHAYIQLLDLGWSNWPTVEDKDYEYWWSFYAGASILILWLLSAVTQSYSSYLNNHLLSMFTQYPRVLIYVDCITNYKI